MGPILKTLIAGEGRPSRSTATGQATSLSKSGELGDNFTLLMVTLNAREIVALRNLLKPRHLDRLDGSDREVLQGLYSRLTAPGPVTLFIDGAADRHHGAAGIGGLFMSHGKQLYSFSEYLAGATSNEAEYQALIRGLELGRELNLNRLKIYADSELIVKQVNGDYRVRNPRMQVLNRQALDMLQELESWSLEHIPRERNRPADRLSKAALRRRSGKRG